ncbi:MAG: hypothetical protein NC411_10505 [Bacteroides sp.]|nr:hypothetical protein [Bacteroides sp.]
MLISILWGVGFVVAWVLVMIVYNIIKASKDPDVKTATNLQMSITKYKKYQRLYDEHWDIMMKHGADSKEAEDFFRTKVYPNIENPNEWRRYENYRSELQRKEMMEQIYNFK